jgi:hypothetical protein
MHSNKPTETDKDEKMQSFTFRLPPSILAAAREKAGLINLSVIFRKLVEKWLAGEIEIE